MQTYISQFSRLNRDYVDYVQMQIKPMYDQLMAQAVDLKHINAEQFYSTHNLLNIHQDDHAGQLFQQHLKPTLTLTARESQCLAYYRQGFTAKQTAKRLGLSFRTIEDYFENIKFKYGVQSKQELLFLP
jgi:DNA-binding CsgD family transcriptional regulator